MSSLKWPFRFSIGDIFCSIFQKLGMWVSILYTCQELFCDNKWKNRSNDPWPALWFPGQHAFLLELVYFTFYHFWVLLTCLRIIAILYLFVLFCFLCWSSGLCSTSKTCLSNALKSLFLCQNCWLQDLINSFKKYTYVFNVMSYNKIERKHSWIGHVLESWLFCGWFWPGQP